MLVPGVLLERWIFEVASAEEIDRGVRMFAGGDNVSGGSDRRWVMAIICIAGLYLTSDAERLLLESGVRSKEI